MDMTNLRLENLGKIAKKPEGKVILYLLAHKCHGH